MTEPTDPSYIAQPPGSCCITGHIHTGKPRGKFQTVANIQTYISSPEASPTTPPILLYFPDVWGHCVNTFLIADTFASHGYLVLVPDYFNGDPVFKYYKNPLDKSTARPGFDFETWKNKHLAFADEHVPLWTKAAKDQFGASGTKYACVGYCFGAPYVCNALSVSEDNAQYCDIGAFAHPAYLKDSHFEKLSRPLWMSCAETDHTFGTEARNKAVDILSNGGKKYHLQLFSSVKHGFALKADMDNPYERWVKESCADGIVGWFDFWLERSGSGDGEK